MSQKIEDKKALLVVPIEPFPSVFLVRDVLVDALRGPDGEAC